MSKVTLAAVALACLTVTACGGSNDTEGGGGGSGDGDKTFEGDGYSFVLPEDWMEFEQGESRARSGEQISPSVWIGPRGGSDSDLMVVDVFRARVAVTQENIDDVSDQLAAEFDQLLGEGGWRMTRDPARVRVDELPGLRFEASGLDPEGERVRSRYVYVLDGRTVYALNCQFTPEGAEEMRRGCDQVIESFQVE